MSNCDCGMTWPKMWLLVVIVGLCFGGVLIAIQQRLDVRPADVRNAVDRNHQSIQAISEAIGEIQGALSRIEQELSR